MTLPLRGQDRDRDNAYIANYYINGLVLHLFYIGT